MQPANLFQNPRFVNMPNPGSHMDGNATPISNFSVPLGVSHDSSVTQVIWGTNISTNEVHKSIREFYTTFNKVDFDGDNIDFNQKPYYI